MKNPLYAEEYEYYTRTIQGGCWFNHPSDTVIAPTRMTAESPWEKGNYMGFRLFRSREKA